MGDLSTESAADPGEIDRAGTVIDGRFAVERLIARGGFGAVYRARRVHDGETVAIKVLELEPDTAATAMERFTREAEFVQGLKSPNTIRIFETGQVGTDFLYSVMEFIAGRSLFRQIRKHGALNPRQVAEVTIQLCDSLNEVHAKGLLHRDLKPSNIMLFRADDGHVVVKVLDFGVAKMLDPPPEYSGLKLTAAGTFIGTPRYASPEQMRREPLTTASDVYAVGMIMWEALVGEPAIGEIEYSACVKAHLSREPWHLPRDRDFPRDMVRIIEKSLAKDVDQRYQSCVELKAALQEFLRNRSASAKAHSGPRADARLDSSRVATSEGETPVSNKDPYQPETKEDVEAEDELFGEVIEQSDAQIDSVNVMSSHDLSEASKPGGSTIQLPHRHSNHAGVEDADRPVAAPPTRAPSGFMVTVILLVIALGGLFVFTMGGDDTPADKTTPEAGSDEVAKTTAPATKEKPAPPPEDDEGRGDGTPTLDADTLTKGMIAAGWRVGEPSVDTMDDVKQTNLLAQKPPMAATVTIYESRTWDWANQLLLDTEPPAQAIGFGRTVVRVSLGPKEHQNGVVELTRTLTDFKRAARAKATQNPGDVPSE